MRRLAPQIAACISYLAQSSPSFGDNLRLLDSTPVPCGQSRETAMLEKRMEKLYAQIAAMENALKTISNSKLYSNQQIQNLMRQLGLAQEDKNFEKKREMLKVVLDVNKLIRKEGGELAAKGITLANPQGAGEGPSVATVLAAQKAAAAPAPAGAGPGTP